MRRLTPEEGHNTPEHSFNGWSPSPVAIGVIETVPRPEKSAPPADVNPTDEFVVAAFSPQMLISDDPVGYPP